MNQSTIIFGYLAVAFLIFITQRGELPIYWGFLVSSPKQPVAGPSATKTGSLSNSQVASTLSGISDLASAFGAGDISTLAAVLV